jgi:thioredoxin reductase
MTYEVVIVGGSYAGLAAATQLARARRTILVVDAAVRRNRYASHAHGFLTQDGTPPGDIARIGKEQLLRYPTVMWRDGRVERITRRDDGTFDVDGDRAERVILALGVRDNLPAIPGLAERWGQSVFHCPYCHGYELNAGPVGVIGTHPSAEHPALMLPDWGGRVFYLAHGNPIADDAREHMQRRGVTIVTDKIVGIRDRATVVLDGGKTLELAGLFVVSQSEPASPLAADLGCEIATAPTGATYIQTDAMKQTSVPNVFAAGDAAMPMGSISLAVADGAMAGMAVHRSLIWRADH